MIHFGLRSRVRVMKLPRRFISESIGCRPSSWAKQLINREIARETCSNTIFWFTLDGKFLCTHVSQSFPGDYRIRYLPPAFPSRKNEAITITFEWRISRFGAEIELRVHNIEFKPCILYAHWIPIMPDSSEINLLHLSENAKLNTGFYVVPDKSPEKQTETTGTWLVDGRVDCRQMLIALCANFACEAFLTSKLLSIRHQLVIQSAFIILEMRRKRRHRSVIKAPLVNVGTANKRQQAKRELSF